MFVRAIASKASITTGNIAVNWLNEGENIAVKAIKIVLLENKKGATHFATQTSSIQRAQSQKPGLLWALPLAQEKLSTVPEAVQDADSFFNTKTQQIYQMEYFF